MDGRSLDLIDHAQHMVDGEGPEPRDDWPLRCGGRVGAGLEAIEGHRLARVEDLVLAAEIVIQVGGG